MWKININYIQMLVIRMVNLRFRFCIITVSGAYKSPTSRQLIILKIKMLAALKRKCMNEIRAAV